MNPLRFCLLPALLAAGLSGCEVDSVSYSTGTYSPGPGYYGGYPGHGHDRPGYRARWWCDRCDRYHDAGDFCRKRDRVLLGFDRWGNPVWSDKRDEDDRHGHHKHKHHHEDRDHDYPRPPFAPPPPPFWR